MPTLSAIAPLTLARLIGRPDTPHLVDVRTEDDFSAEPRLVPGAIRRDLERVADWGAGLLDRPAVLICAEGHARSEGAAATLRRMGGTAEILEGGHAAWVDAGQATVPWDRLPTRNVGGATLWVTRARPKIDRIACPWLIRRFIDPLAQVLFVSAAEVLGVAKRFGATPFDIDAEIDWTHRGELCSFDVMVQEFGLSGGALEQMASIVRGADTDRLDLAPEAAGLRAFSLGLSRMYADDNTQMEAGFVLYDALYRWCCHATDETHDWPTNRGRS